MAAKDGDKRRACGPTRRSLDRAIAEGIEYLLDRRDGALWSDFPSLAGGSDEWISAYVAAKLAGTASTSARDAARESWHTLKRRRRWSAGWGYHRTVPADADSTAWALMLLNRLDASARITDWRARRFLSRHVTDDGGVATYCPNVAIKQFVGRLDRSFEGWFGPHPSVAGVVAPFLDPADRRSVRSYLRTAQRETGAWRGYWWPDQAYPTAIAVRELGGSDDSGDRRAVRAALDWALDVVNAPGLVPSRWFSRPSPFATACCLAIFCLVLSGTGQDSPPDRDRNPSGLLQPAKRETVRQAAGRTAAWLVAHQRSDGGWTGSATLRVPPPDCRRPTDYDDWQLEKPRVGGIHLDKGRAFTTATVVQALHQAATSEVVS